MTSRPCQQCSLDCFFFCLTSRLICICYATRFGLVGREIGGRHQTWSKGRLRLPVTTAVGGYLVVLAHCYIQDTMKLKTSCCCSTASCILYLERHKMPLTVFSLSPRWPLIAVICIRKHKWNSEDGCIFQIGWTICCPLPPTCACPVYMNGMLNMFSGASASAGCSLTPRGELTVRVWLRVRGEWEIPWKFALPDTRRNTRGFNVWLGCLSCRLRKEEVILYSDVNVNHTYD